MNEKCGEMKQKLDNSIGYYSSQLTVINELNTQMELLRKQTSECIDEKTALLDQKENLINQLQVEISCMKSKIDETYLHMNEMKKSHSNQIKQVWGEKKN